MNKLLFILGCKVEHLRYFPVMLCGDSGFSGLFSVAEPYGSVFCLCLPFSHDEEYLSVVNQKNTSLLSIKGLRFVADVPEMHF